MKKNLCLLTSLVACLALTACGIHLKLAPVMTEERFESVPIGIDINDLEAQYGMPFDRIVVDIETEEYRYVQRVEVSPGCTQQIDYIFKVELGKVVDKQIKPHKGPASLRFE